MTGVSIDNPSAPSDADLYMRLAVEGGSFYCMAFAKRRSGEEAELRAGLARMFTTQGAERDAIARALVATMGDRKPVA